MTSLFTINTCKTFGCRNLGQPTSPDYRWPDYRLGYPALHCQACGSYPPLFNDTEFRGWASAYLSGHALKYGHFCPDCYHAEVIRYGHNPGGNQRLQCQHCKKVWTPKQQPLENIAAPEAICSVPLIVPFQGARAAQNLYFLLSFDAIHGNVIHISSNFTPHSAGASLHYRWQGLSPAFHKQRDVMQRVAQNERQFFQRSQFDEVQYGASSLKRNVHGMILRPVITAHGHFRVLKIRFPNVRTHIVAHECFLRGAVITVWSEQFRQRQGSLWFVEEDIHDEQETRDWRLQGKTFLGWWKNPWQHWEQGHNHKMICSLTGVPLKNGAGINLTASRLFLTWLSQQSAFQQSNRFCAKRVTHTVQALAQDYNALLQ